ncbi:hypothetical protein D6777_02865 [Candidatus Woesearchaeota archaeon]|nr:MAG: hypothetical protein D6777_02865 [Candidatus Woesearchaeota archaeon]
MKNYGLWSLVTALIGLSAVVTIFTVAIAFVMKGITGTITANSLTLLFLIALVLAWAMPLLSILFYLFEKRKKKVKFIALIIDAVVLGFMLFVLFYQLVALK